MKQQLRGKVQNNKIKAKTENITRCFSDQHPWFSFRGMTPNSRYNLSALRSGAETEKTLLGLYSRLQELSEKPWTYWNSQRKSTGLETLNYSDLNFKANQSVALSGDDCIYVFRFDTHRGNKAGRIIGYKSSPCSVLHIIGYDLDYSAYNHGK